MCVLYPGGIAAEEINTMSTGEDECSPGLNGRLRPRKSTATTPSPQNKPIRKTESKLAQDRPKRNSTPSKVTTTKQDDLATKSDTLSDPLILCPYCDRKFGSKQTATKHARRIHLPTTKQDTFIKCLHCNHSDAEPHAIIKHMVDNHPNQYFACLDCYTRFLSTTLLAEHKHSVCDKQKAPYRSRLRQKISTGDQINTKNKSNADQKNDSPKENAQLNDNHGFNGIVISCELKPSGLHDEADIEQKITTNLILPPSKTLGSTGLEKNAVIVLDELTWNKRMPPNFTFHNTDADQILSRLGVVHRSPRVGESRKDLIRMMDEPNEKFEKCFDTSFYSRVTKNVQENLAKYLDGSFKFDPNKDSTIKTRKSKTSVVINTAEGFPILLACEQFSRNFYDGFMPRSLAPKHKWKWDSAESDKNLMMLLDQSKRDSHVNSCIITLVSSLDIWTQLRMKRKFEEIYKMTPAAKKKEKQNIISLELKEILESRDIPTTSTKVVPYTTKEVASTAARSELPDYLGLSPTISKCEVPRAVLSGEWVRPRCYVCCACGDQTRDARALSSHITTNHPNAQVQHYEIVGETLLSADILKHLYVPPSQISNRTRPPRGFKDCTKCNKSVTLEDLHQHMLDCAGDTPTVRRKCRYRPFGVRRRRTRLPDTKVRKKMRKNIRSRRHRQKARMRPRVRTEVGDAESIRKMIADLPAKRNRITTSNVLRPRRTVIKTKTTVRLRTSDEVKSNNTRVAKILTKVTKTDKPVLSKKQSDSDNDIDEDDQPLKVCAKRISTRSKNSRDAVSPRRTRLNKSRKITKKRPSIEDKDGNKTVKRPHRRNSSRFKSGQDKVQPHFVKSIPDICPQGPPPYYIQPPLPVYHPPGLEIEQTNNYQIDVYRRQYLQSEDRRIRLTIERDRHSKFAADSLMQNVLHSNQTREFKNLMLREQGMQVQLNAEHENQRIDLRSAELRNIRQYGNGDRHNVHYDNERPIGRRNDSRQNSRTARVTKVPLNHSIENLTSQVQLRKTPTPDSATSQSPEIGVVTVNEPSDSLKPESDVVSEKLDKPPLAVKLKDFMESDEVGQNESVPEPPLLTQNTDNCSNNIITELESGVESKGASEMSTQVSVNMNEVEEQQRKDEQPDPPEARMISNVDRSNLPVQHSSSADTVEEQKEFRVKRRKGLDDVLFLLRGTFPDCSSYSDISDIINSQCELKTKCSKSPDKKNSDSQNIANKTSPVDNVDNTIKAKESEIISTNKDSDLENNQREMLLGNSQTRVETMHQDSDNLIRDCKTSPEKVQSKPREPTPVSSIISSCDEVSSNDIHTNLKLIPAESFKLNPDNASPRSVLTDLTMTPAANLGLVKEDTTNPDPTTCVTVTSIKHDQLLRPSTVQHLDKPNWENNTQLRTSKLTPHLKVTHARSVSRESMETDVSLREKTPLRHVSEYQSDVIQQNTYEKVGVVSDAEQFLAQQRVGQVYNQHVYPMNAQNYPPAELLYTDPRFVQYVLSHNQHMQSEMFSHLNAATLTKEATISQGQTYYNTPLAPEISPLSRKTRHMPIDRPTSDGQYASLSHVSHKNAGSKRTHFVSKYLQSNASSPNLKKALPARQEFIQRPFDNADTYVDQNLRAVDTRPKMSKISAEPRFQTDINYEIMRRHSIELASVQSHLYNYNTSKTQSNRDYRKNDLNVPLTKERHSNTFRATSDEFLNQRNLDNTNNDTQLLHVPDASFVLPHQGTGGVVHLNMSNKGYANEIPQKIQDTRDVVINKDKTYEKANKCIKDHLPRSRNDSESNTDVTKDNERTYAEYESTLNATENYPFKHRVASNSAERHNRPSPYHRNVSSTNPANIYGARSYSLQSCNTTVTQEDYYNLTRPPPPPPPIPTVENEDVPLDLSLVTKIRDEYNLETYNMYSNMFNTPVEIKPEEVPVIVNFPQNLQSSQQNFTNRYYNDDMNQDVIYISESDSQEINFENEEASISRNEVDFVEEDENYEKKTPIFTERNTIILNSSELNNLPYNSNRNNDSLHASDYLNSKPCSTKNQEVTQDKSQLLPESLITSEESPTVQDVDMSHPQNVTNDSPNFEINAHEIQETRGQNHLSAATNDTPIDKQDSKEKVIPTLLQNSKVYESEVSVINASRSCELKNEQMNCKVLEKNDEEILKKQNNSTSETPLSSFNSTDMSPTHFSLEGDSSSRSFLGSNEAQPSTSVCHQSHHLTLSLSSPLGHAESSKGQTNHSQNETCKELHESEINTLLGHAEREVDAFSRPNIINKNIMTVDNNFVPPSSSQSLLHKLPAKIKSSNEQTASLRAVRIKTTRKSSSDEINLMANNENILVEKYNYLEPIKIQTQHEIQNVNNIENADAVPNIKPKINNHFEQLEDEKTALLEYRSKEDLDMPITSVMSTITDVDVNIASKVDTVSTAVSQFNSTITANKDDCQVAEDNESEPIATVQDDNMYIDRSLEPVNSSAIDIDAKKQEISTQKQINENLLQDEFENKSVSLMDNNKIGLKTDPKSHSLESIENGVLQPLYTISNQKDTLPIFTEDGNESSDKDKAKGETSQTTIFPGEILSAKDNKSSDDSEDDVSLAIIKQKNADKPNIVKTRPRNKKETKRVKLKNEIKKVSRKLVLKQQKKNKLVILTSNQSNTRCKDSSNLHKDTEYGVVSNIDDYDEELTSYYKNAKTITSSNILIDKQEDNDKSKMNIDKKSNFSDEIPNVEENSQNRQLGNVIDTNIEHDLTQANNTDTINRLNLLEKVEEPIADFGIDKKEFQLTLGNKNQYLKPVQCADYINSDKGCETLQKISCDKGTASAIYTDINYNPDVDIIYSATGTAVSEPFKSPEDSTNEFEVRIPTPPSSVEKTAGESHICSELQEMNTTPLRRSRRGKSMYVDSSTLIDEHVQQSAGQKSHLTKKRLILSRVEKDRERINQDIVKDDGATERQQLTDSETTDLTVPKRLKRIKRKQSPPLKRKTKKAKSLSEQQYEDEITDTSSILSTADNNSAILRELRNSDNKIEDKDNRIDGVKSHAVSDNTTNIFENATEAVKDNICEFLGESVSDNKEPVVPGKRKLNISKDTDTIANKSKKSKHNYQIKSSSDFDSDDDKGLSETKQQLDTEKLLITSDSDSTNDKSLSLLHKDNNKGVSCDFVNTDTPKLATNASLMTETRTTCYSRDVSNKRPNSYCDSKKNKANYDPYDINLEDMPETAKPVIKKKGKNSGISYSNKVKNEVKTSTKNVVKTVPKKIEMLPVVLQSDKNIVSSNDHHESDSDSSKSDEPLQKYVKEKTLEIQSRSKSINERLKFVENEKKEAENNLISVEVTLDSIDCLFSENDNAAIDNTNSEIKETSCDESVLNINDNSNTNVVLNNDIQQLKSDKFMEKFGFYSERIPRKSNLLASKKISETFQVISNDSDDAYYPYKDKTTKKSTQNENKKKSDSCNDIIASQDLNSDRETLLANSASTSADVNTTYDESLEFVEVDAATAEKMLNSEDIKRMENDLIYGISETPDSNAAPFFVNRRNNPLSIAAPPPVQIVPIAAVESNENRTEVNPEPKKLKPKADKPPGYKAKMYPDVEEFDMFEDKFDKIKRKRRSQAVAAKQVQATVETSARNKSRKQAEKKKSMKNVKQVQQNAQVPTKGALKGFDGIKISIPTQDLNMPPSVSPPRQQKRKKKVTNKRRKDTIEWDSTCSESDDKVKTTAEKDIYEFKDNEDTELLELRLSTVMDRFRSINKLIKDKEKEEGEKEKPKEKTKERKSETKDKEFTNEEKVKAKRREKYHDNDGKKSKKQAARDNIQKTSPLYNDADKETYVELHSDTSTTRIDPAANQNLLGKEKSRDSQCYGNATPDRDGNIFEETDNALPGPSGFVPDRIDESDYDSDVTSPEGDFIFYTSEDLNCVCPSDNDSEESDGERSCGRPNCLYKNRNADKKAAIGNIFKNNAVRCEKPEIKLPDLPKPDMDQLFDSLLENKTKNEVSNTRNEIVSERPEHFLAPMHAALGRDENTRKPKSPISQQDVDVLSKRRDLRASSKKESRTLSIDTKISSKIHSHNRKSDDELMSEPEVNPDDYEIPTDIYINPPNGDQIVNQNEESYEYGVVSVPRDTTKSARHTTDQSLPELDDERTSGVTSPFSESVRCSQNLDLSNYSEAETGCQSATVPETDYFVSNTEVSGNAEENDNTDISSIPRNDDRDSVEVSYHKFKTTKTPTEKKKRRKSYRHRKAEESGTSKSKDRSKEGRSKSRKKLPSETDEGEFAAPASLTIVDVQSPTRADDAGSGAERIPEVEESAAPQRARRKCTVGKQNVLAEHWSSESEVEGRPPRPNSTDSAITSVRKKKKKRDGQPTSSKKSKASKTDSKVKRRGASADRASEGESRPRGPSGPKIRARPAQCWTSDGEDGSGPQPLHGWIVGNSHKKLVTLLAHKKGGKCANPENNE